MNTKYKFGFTLAEVLITLVVIGIIAAITVPSVQQNTQNKELIARLKKCYSTIQNAIYLAQKDEGVIGDNTLIFDVEKSSYEVALNFAKYLNGAKVCRNSSSEGCSNLYYSGKYATGKTGTPSFNNYPKILLNDGSSFIVQQFTSCYREQNDCVQDSDGNCIKDDNGNTTPKTTIHKNCATIMIDTNGFKKPNQYGRDMFELKIYENSIGPGNWEPYGGTSFSNILNGKDKLVYQLR